MPNAISKEVSASVSGPRLSEVFVDYQAIPLSGTYARSGKKTIELDPPTIDVFVFWSGQIGANTKLSVEINFKKKEESFVIDSEKGYKKFSYQFADFGL